MDILKDYFTGLRKLPIGIRLFAGLILSLSATNLLSIQKISQYIPSYSLYFYLLVFPILFISGIFLLRLKEWARVVIIVISLLASIELAISSPYVLNNIQGYYTKQYTDMKERFNLMMKNQGHPINSINYNEMGDIAKNFEVSSQCRIVEMGVVYSFLLYLGSIFYFTRPKVKKFYKK